MLSWFSNHLSKTKSSFSFVIRILLITQQLQPVHLASIPYGPGRLASNLSNSTNLQSLFNVSTALTRPSRHLSPHGTPPGIPQKETDSILLDECMSRPLSPRLWTEMGMNEFLRDYRNGENLNLLQLANQANLTNFDCGIEKLCYADQLCQPVRGKEWYILVAAQEWNTFMNAAYQSIGWAMTMMQGVAPSLVHDFYPDLPDTWSIIKAILTFACALAKVIPTEGLLTYPKWLYQLIQGEFGLFAGVSNLMDDIIMKNPVNQHDKWTAFSYALSKSQDQAQMAIANLSQSVIEAGISTENGMYGVLKDGNFLMRSSKTHKKNHEKLDNVAGNKESEMKVSVQLHLLAAIWEQQNYFITRGSDPCTGAGPDGAWGGDKVLSYCGPDNVMMNIIQAKGKHAVNHVHNAKLVTEKYNFSVKFLTEAAWNCQKQSGKFEFDVWNSTDPIKFDDQCSFNLPVCDLTRPDIREYRDSGAGTVAACRIIGGLPI
ncbi:hypothetical protein MJO28_000680 [Puccinia striiformis f. sp. tritici]|uniref:DUF7872 domain-containing protein n=3 Tax=Puccinia striiformis TaxID=27350 RepID=A0A0L0URR7_9BASI|nr:hypothetical protein Pst134EB_001774 [Puccinia striiformis f. sp. tritici]KAI7962586.1 hypothetical protein MJO28_000680 [Puccinia striiformis f. sp. tritici]KAI7967292.1 hypothetical protein MJO29_000569 [Puccinia striiformis f. sp. tritici]KNE89773.1 hypothetical protein PSTG_16768 [Puccinia striiformis f. sp. tritici PST-78]POV97518.1 hypothetical protein PSTT_15022 [Puccinia striiformis]